MFALNSTLQAAVGGSISGNATDPSGALLPNVAVTATDVDTGLRQVVWTNAVGAYSFADLPVGHYDVSVAARGFRPYRRTGIAVDVDSSLIMDAILQVGDSSSTVTVTESRIQPETASTQLGDVIPGAAIEFLPLNGRSYTDLLALQPGVVPVTTITALTVQGLGQSVFSPSGDLNPGNLSINGQRESANGFTVNGADAEEPGSLAAAIVPNLDSIAEFRILSDNFDAEYGRYTGGQINVITRSGTNQFHGNSFDFLRNTVLDARNYFSPTRGTFIQNQFGQTLGGAIVRSRVFSFSDYQGSRQIQGTDTGLIPVPSLPDRSGDLADKADLLTGSVSGPYWASLLSQKLGYAVVAGEPYYLPGCTTSARCVLPNAVVPQSAFSAPAQRLLQYIPAPTSPGSVFSTSAYKQILNDDRFAERIDLNNRWGSSFAYYFFDNYAGDNPYPTAEGGANIPGFNALNEGRAQLAVLGNTRVLGARAVNEIHISYARDANNLGQAAGGLGVSFASQGFVTGANTLGIVPLAREGVANVFFNNLTIGAAPDRYYQINNTYAVSDHFSRTFANHTLKAGIQAAYYQVNTHPFADLNGSFDFYGTESGLDFADFLLGIASQYTQNDLRSFYGRNQYLAAYLQDSWRATHSLILNYGLRWDRLEPWYEKYNNNITLVPGEQSNVFPSAPAGIVYPGDPGIRRTLAPASNRDFAPRFGLAYSPHGPMNSRLGRLLGEAGKTSMRGGAGLFYAAIPEETLGLVSDNAPYGFTYTSPAPPLFATPFVDAATGYVEGQRFPARLAPLSVSRRHPDPSIDFSQFEPISATPGYRPGNTIPYTVSYMLSLQRQVRESTLVSLSYVGNQAHHLLVLQAANPGNPALCLGLSNANQVAPGSAVCGPFGESTTFTSASGQVIPGTRGPLGPAFGSVSYQTTIGNSTFNALEASLQHNGPRVHLYLSYTYAKSLDDASNFGEQVYPFNAKLLRGLSSFDIRNNLVASFTWNLPFDYLFAARNRVTEGWSISGITRFASGLPVTFYNYQDTSLLGTQGNGINNLAVDELERVPGPLRLNHSVRSSPFFNPSLYSLPPLGSIGNSGRRAFSGPGMDNYDLSLQKQWTLSEGTYLEFRTEAFNAFNHAQFYGPGAVDGNYGSPTFGYAVSAAAPRLMQIALKLAF